MVLHMDLCARFERRLGAYVDGELDAVHSVEVEDHIEGCAACREQVAMLSAMRSSLRRVGRLRAPSSLRDRLLVALEEERQTAWPGEHAAHASSASAPLFAPPAVVGAGVGAAAEHRAPKAKPGLPPRATEGQLIKLRYVFPLAAAAMFVLVLSGVWKRDEASSASTQGDETTHRVASGAASVAGPQLPVAAPEPGADEEARAIPNAGLPPFEEEQESGMSWPSSLFSGQDGAGSSPVGATLASLDSLLEDLVERHAEPLPPETTDPRGLERFDKYVGVRVVKPRYEPFGGRYLGARLHPLRGRSAAMLQYMVGNKHRLTLYVFDARGVPMRGQLLTARAVGAQPMFVGQLRGYTVAASEQSGVGYALASDLDDKESTKLILAAAAKP